MDCLYFAFQDAVVEEVGRLPRPSTWLLYKSMKLVTHGVAPQYTFGGVAPWMIRKMADHNGLFVEGYWKYFGVPEYLAVSKKHYPMFYPIHRLVIKPRYLGDSYNTYMSSHSRLVAFTDESVISAWDARKTERRLSKEGGIWLMGSSQHAQYCKYKPNGLIYGFCNIRRTKREVYFAIY